MTSTYIKNATWAPTGERFDIRLAPGHSQVVPELGSLTLSDAEVRPAGQLEIPDRARVTDAGRRVGHTGATDLRVHVR